MSHPSMIIGFQFFQKSAIARNAEWLLRCIPFLTVSWMMRRVGERGTRTFRPWSKYFPSLDIHNLVFWAQFPFKYVFPFSGERDRGGARWCNEKVRVYLASLPNPPSIFPLLADAFAKQSSAPSPPTTSLLSTSWSISFHLPIKKGKPSS